MGRWRRVQGAAVAAAPTVAAVLVLIGAGCSSPTRCEPGLCPSGTRCVPDTGRCEAASGSGAALAPRLFGGFSALAVPGPNAAFVGWVPERRSLAYLELRPEGVRTAWIAGPAVDPQQPAAGRHSAAFAASDGAVHVAYRDADGRLWYARRDASRWQREPIETVPPGSVGAHLAVAVWEGRPAVLFERSAGASLGFVYREDGLWRPESVHPPAGSSADHWRLGGRLALSPFGRSIVAVAHDHVGHNLVVASRSAGVWTTAVIAGPAATAVAAGQSGRTAEAGRACAVTRDLHGDLVVAWRDAARDRVMLARSGGGPIKHEVIADGARLVAELGVQRRDLVGTDLSIVSLPGGRLVLAFQDGSRMRVRVAAEQAAGGFALSDVPDSGRPQLGPRVVARADGRAEVSWLELDPASLPAGGRVTTLVAAGTGP